MITTKFEDILNSELSKRDEAEAVDQFSYLARSEDRVRNAFKKKKLGTLLRKNDPYEYSYQENFYAREGRLCTQKEY